MSCFKEVAVFSSGWSAALLLLYWPCFFSLSFLLILGTFSKENTIRLVSHILCSYFFIFDTIRLVDLIHCSYPFVFDAIQHDITFSAILEKK